MTDFPYNTNIQTDDFLRDKVANINKTNVEVSSDFIIKDKNFLHYFIIFEKKVIGYIGFHPMVKPFASDIQIRIFIDPDYQGK